MSLLRKRPLIHLIFISLLPPVLVRLVRLPYDWLIGGSFLAATNSFFLNHALLSEYQSCQMAQLGFFSCLLRRGVFRTHGRVAPDVNLRRMLNRLSYRTTGFCKKLFFQFICCQCRKNISLSCAAWLLTRGKWVYFSDKPLPSLTYRKG